MSHATAFAQPRNPSDDGDQLSSAIEHAREAIARPESDNDDGHAAESLPPSSTFFRALAAQSKAPGCDGQTWAGGRFGNHGMAERIAAVDRTLSGLEGVLSMIHAAYLAEGPGQVEEVVSPYLIEKLMVSARELAQHGQQQMDLLRRMRGEGS